jgi:hypothetical protein
MRDFTKLPSFKELQASREAAEDKSRAVAEFTQGDHGSDCGIEPETNESVARGPAEPFDWKNCLPKAAGWYIARAVNVHSASDVNTIAWFDGNQWGGWGRIGLHDDRMRANKHYVHSERIVWLRPCTLSEIPAFEGQETPSPACGREQG